MVRFFVSPEELAGEYLTLSGENAQHAKVLRLKAGEQVLVCDGAGSECLCEITDSSFGLHILERRESTTEASVQVSDYLLSDLIGLDIVFKDTVYGVVRDYSNDLNPLLSIEYDKNYYIPINSNYIKSVNLEEKRIYVEDIEGLII